MTITNVEAKWMFQAEGGWCNVAGDKGGETMFGIARNYHPEWSGWLRVDKLKQEYPDKKVFISKANADADLQELAQDFYMTEYIVGRYILSLPIRSRIATLDCLFNHGRGPKLVKQCLNVLGQNIPMDNTWSTNTARSVFVYVSQPAPAESVYIEKLCEIRMKYYAKLVEETPSLAKFLQGWHNRIIKLKAFLASI